MDKEIIICVGISGSGKSTWTTKFLKENHNFLRINRDDIRKTLVGDLNGYYQRSDLNKIEEVINYMETKFFHDIWGMNKYPIIDNTNLKEKYINKWITNVNQYNSARALGFYPNSPVLDFKFKLFDIELEEARFRVHIRETGRERVLYNAVIQQEKAMNDKSLDYIDKQYKDYQLIKEYILKHYKEKIIT
jgi:adenylate kinase family enzyme